MGQTFKYYITLQPKYTDPVDDAITRIRAIALADDFFCDINGCTGPRDHVFETTKAYFDGLPNTLKETLTNDRYR